MRHVTGREFVDERDQAAAEWAVRRREGLSPAERAALHRWLAEHPENVRSLEQSEQVWSELGGVDLRGVEAQVARPARTDYAVPRWAAIAAAVVLVALAIIAVYAPTGRAYATDRGQVRTVQLADGSTVTLGAQSRILVRYGSDGRRVELRSGEAVFDIRHDPARPFEVMAADTRVVVLGTRFAVKAAPGGVRVDVIEGVVRVAKAENPIIAPFIRNQAVGEKIVRGQRLESPRGENLRPLASINPVEVAPWTQGRLVYENASLAEVVADLNRYAPGQVKLASPELGALRVTAALRQEQAPTFVRTLPTSLPVTVEQRDDGSVVIRPAVG